MNSDITVKDILNNPYFCDFKILAGESALNKRVSSITVMDAPDPFPWSKGGEIVLSSGYIFKVHFNEFSEIIMKMHRAGIAALFIKVKRFFNQLPKEILTLADEVGLPIIEVPLQMVFTEVINPALAQIIDIQSEALKISEKINSTFTDLVINNEDTKSIINALSVLLNEDILYYDINFQRTYYSCSIEMISEKFKDFNLNEVLEKHHYYTIGINKEVYGYIIYFKFKEDDIEKDNYDALSHANTALILDVQKKISSMQIEDRHKNEFVQDIIMNNIKYKEKANKRAEIYGWDFSRPICVMVVDIDNFKDDIMDIHKSYGEALVSNKIGRVLYKKDAIVFIRNLVFLDCFIQYMKMKRLGSLASQVLAR